MGDGSRLARLKETETPAGTPLEHQRERSRPASSLWSRATQDGEDPSQEAAIAAQFKELLPQSVSDAQARRQIPMRRPPPPAPRAPSPEPPPPALLSESRSLPHPGSVPVDGVPESTILTWFREADEDGDGRVMDDEARRFFLRTGLLPADLSRIWRLVKSPEVVAREGKGLSERRFRQVLRLVALAQTGLPFSETNAAAALDAARWLQLHGEPLPAPRLQAGAAGLLRRAPPQQPDGSQTPLPLPARQASEVSGSSLPLLSGAPASEAQASAQPSRAPPSGPVHPIPRPPFEMASLPAAPSAAAERDLRARAAAAREGASAVREEKAGGEDEGWSRAPSLPKGHGEFLPSSVVLGVSADGVVALPPELGGGDAWGDAPKRVAEGGARRASAAQWEQRADGAPESRGWSVLEAPPRELLGSFPARASLHPSEALLGEEAAAGSKALPLPRPGPDAGPSSLPPPVPALDLRLPPLYPRLSMRLSFLAAAGASLFAGPAHAGGLAQWAVGPGAELARSGVDEDGAPLAGEDWEPGTLCPPHEDADAAPCAETLPPGRKPACGALADPLRGVLWVAEMGGWVTGYRVARAVEEEEEGCGAALLGAEDVLYRWQAFGVGHITAMCMAADGALWTGSSRGHLRLWPLPAPPGPRQPLAAPLACREVRRAASERAHGAAVLALACAADGQVLWSASRKGAILWDAACGAYLGSVARTSGDWAKEVGSRDGEDGGEAEGVLHLGPSLLKQSRSSSIQPHPVPASPRPPTPPAPAPRAAGRDGAPGGAAFEQALARSSAASDAVPGSYAALDVLERPARAVPPQLGLAADARTGRLLDLAAPADWARLAAEQEAWVALADRSVSEFVERVSMSSSKALQSAHKAVRAIGKLGRRVARNLAGEEDDVPELGRLSDASHPPGSERGLEEESAAPPGAAPAHSLLVGLAASAAGPVWMAHAGGQLEARSSAGRLLWRGEVQGSVNAVLAVGRALWVAHAGGLLSVLRWEDREAEARVASLFQAHEAPAVSLAHCGRRVYSLAADGSIKAWPADAGRRRAAWDAPARARWARAERESSRRRAVDLAAVTWNAGETRPAPGGAFYRRLRAAAAGASLVAVALQEIEMGGSSVAMAAAKEALSARMQERGNANAKLWCQGVGAALGGEGLWRQVGMRQMSGMLLLLLARADLAPWMGELATASVACGVLGVGGNKGAVALEFSLHRHRVAVVCAHFAAHQGAVEARNANYALVCRGLTFYRRAGLPELPAAARERREALGEDASDEDAPLEPVLAESQALRRAAAVVWAGDFNYRVDAEYETVREAAIRGDLEALRPLDQCLRERRAGRVFAGLREAPLSFNPTYKFDKGAAYPFAYDSSEKRRVPAWCDRILFRGSADGEDEDEEGEGEERAAPEARAVAVRCLRYESWADVCDSDHKPVAARLRLDVHVADGRARRAAVRALHEELSPRRAVDLSAFGGVSLQAQALAVGRGEAGQAGVTLRNAGQAEVEFVVSQRFDCAASPGEARDRRPRASVVPARGLLPPGASARLHVGVAAPPEARAADLCLRVALLDPAAGWDARAPGLDLRVHYRP